MGKETLLEKLKVLEENIHYLRTFKESHSLDDVLRDKMLEWAVRYGIFESIQIVIDVSCALCAEYNLGNPKSYRECIEFLVKYNYIESYIGDELVKIIGLRNLLVHEYIKINIEKLFNLLGGLETFVEFIKQIKGKLL